MFELAVLCVLLVVTTLLAATAIAHLFLRVPYVPTPTEIVDAMIAEATLKPNDVVYDLGAGDARMLIAAAKACPGVKAAGCEVVPTIWALGRIRIALARVPVRLTFESAMKMSVRDATVVLLYLTPHLLRQLEGKFDAELPKGTRVLSHRFRFAGRTPEKTVEVPIRFGRSRKIHVYRW